MQRPTNSNSTYLSPLIPFTRSCLESAVHHRNQDLSHVVRMQMKKSLLPTPVDSSELPQKETIKIETFKANVGVDANIDVSS